jgi:hypothetical protein
MQIAFLLLIALIGISPALFVVGGSIIHGLLTAYAAVAVAVVGLTMRPGEAGYLLQVTRPVAVLAAIPALWMLIQIVPMPIGDLVHPIWTSAQAAMHDPMTGSISLDRGATLVAITRYSFFAGIVFVAAAVTIDRVRAELVLFWLTGLTTFAAVALIVVKSGDAKFFDEFVSADGRTTLACLAGLGTIMNAAAAVRAVERYETRRTKSDAPFSTFLWTINIYVVAFALCLLAVVFFTSGQAIFVTTSGLTTFVIVTIVRRFGLRGWESSLIVAAMFIVMIAIAFTHSASGDVTLRFAEEQPSTSIPIAESILSDTRWAGNGAGTFASVLPIYQDIDGVVRPYAPTAAANIAIELGRPAFFVVLITAIALLILLLRGALQRGRDSFYPIAGASCVVLLTNEAFCDATLFTTVVLIVAGAILGLALAQRASRTNQP